MRSNETVLHERAASSVEGETRDDKGNAVLYRYKAEDGQGVDLDMANERNRGPLNDVRRTANRYLKRIHYGNRTPLLDDAGHRPRFLDKAEIDAQIADVGWMVEVVFDYGEHDDANDRALALALSINHTRFINALSHNWLSDPKSSWSCHR